MRIDKCIRTQARKLPAGWEWHDWSDGSGALVSPGGQRYYEYDTAPYGGIGEIEYRPAENTKWKIFAGTLSEYKATCERRLAEDLIRCNATSTSSQTAMTL